MLVLLFILLIGVAGAKAGVLNAGTNKALTAIVINIAQCAMILGAVINVDMGLTAPELLKIVAIAFLTYGLLIVCSLWVPRVLGTKGRERGVYQFACIFGNAGYMGFPVIASIFGQEAVFYAALFNIPFNILAYSYGIRILSGGGESAKFQWKRLINPPFAATLGALVITLTKIHIPTPIADAMDMLGDMVAPSAMLIIGGSLGSLSFKDVFGKWKTYLFLPFKLIIVPIFVWFVLHFIVKDQMILGIATVIASLPVATNATMLCIQYKGDEKTASRLVFVSTVVSVVTIPLMVYLLLI